MVALPWKQYRNEGMQGKALALTLVIVLFLPFYLGGRLSYQGMGGDGQRWSSVLGQSDAGPFPPHVVSRFRALVKEHHDLRAQLYSSSPWYGVRASPPPLDTQLEERRRIMRDAWVKWAIPPDERSEEEEEKRIQWSKLMEDVGQAPNFFLLGAPKAGTDYLFKCAITSGVFHPRAVCPNLDPEEWHRCKQSFVLPPTWAWFDEGADDTKEENITSLRVGKELHYFYNERRYGTGLVKYTQASSICYFDRTYPEKNTGDLERFGKVWKGLERFGKVWKGLERFHQCRRKEGGQVLGLPSEPSTTSHPGWKPKHRQLPPKIDLGGNRTAYVTDFTPNYLSIPFVPQRLFYGFSSEERKKMRFVMILRDPVDRAYSNYIFFKDGKYRGAPFLDVVIEELEMKMECLNAETQAAIQGNFTERESWIWAWSRCDAYQLLHDIRLRVLEESAYVEGILQWLAFFDKDQFLILTSKELHDWARVIPKLGSLLGIEIDVDDEVTSRTLHNFCDNKAHSQKYSPLPPALRDLINEYFAPFITELDSLLPALGVDTAFLHV